MRIVGYFIIVSFVLILAACSSSGGAALGLQPGFNTQGLSKQQILQHQAVFFDSNQTSLSSDAVRTIELHARYLIANPDQAVLLVGNTQTTGSRNYNIVLANARVDGVADVLMANGVQRSQIFKVSYGAEVPLACAASSTSQAINRRVNILYCQSSNCKQVAKNYGQILCSYSN